MRHLALISLTLSLVLVTMMLYCVDLPQDPAENPKYADVSFLIDNVLIHQGDTPTIGVNLFFPQHFQTVTVSTSCDVFNESFNTDTLELIDTVYFKPQFNINGPCTVFVNAQHKDTELRDKCDTLPLYVLSKETGIYFITEQAPIKTITGKTDTLLFVTRVSGGTILPPEYKVSAIPSTGITLTSLYSQQKDTVRIVIVASVADTFTIRVVASALYGNSFVDDSAFTGIRVHTAGLLLPSNVSIPGTIPLGSADTLVFSIDNSSTTDKLTMKLTTKTPLDPAVFSLLPTGTDSVLIAVKPTQAGTANLGIIISNSTRSDTSWYQVTLGTIDTSLWNQTEVAIASMEGKSLKHDLRQYFIKTQTGSVAFSSDIGTVKDTIWEWTPPYGSDTTASATITATSSTAVSKIKLTITITPSDTIKPQISLVDPTLDGKKIDVSQVKVNCIAKDREAGIDTVTITCGSTTIPAVLEQDSIYSGVVSGLENGKPVEITVTAVDKSMRKNISVLKFTVTYDSTASGIAPEITTQLPATVQVIEGTRLSLKIIASGSPAPTYKWYKGNELQTAQTSSEFVKDSVTVKDSGSYYVVVNNGIGTGVTSTKTVVTIRLKAKITQDPVATTVNEGGNGSFTVKAVGEEPLSYQWFRDGELIIGATSSICSVTSAIPVDNGKKFTCIVSNSINKDTSSEGVLTVTTKPVYQVFFETGDGVTAPAIQQIAEGGKITQPAVPSRSGYDFSGWYKDAATTYSWNFTTDIVNGPVTLYAKWSVKIYTITYNLNNGSSGNNPTSYSITSDNLTLTDASRVGYTFAGWYENDGLTGTAVTAIPKGSTGDKVLWAKWTTKDYTITYTLNGGTNSDNNPAVYTVTSTLITLASPNRTGYTFGGWYDNSGLSGSPITTIPAGSTGDKTFWAKWTTTSYIITYNLNDGTNNANNPATYTVTSTLITLASPKRTGYTFGGWYDNSGLSGSPITTIPAGSTGDKTFWAKWTIINPNITNQPVSVTVDAGNSTSFVVSASAPTGTTLMYQWQKNGSNITDGTGNNSSLSLSGVTKNDSAAQYRCLISTNTGGSVASNVAVLNVVSIKAVSTGANHTMILKTDGTLWATGNGVAGQLGNGTTTDISFPVPVLANVASVSCGYTSTMALKADGTLWATGSNNEGQLGNGTKTNVVTFVQVMANVAAVSSGQLHTLILKTDGTLWATGQNTYGQFGNGLTTSVSTPVQVMSDVTSFSAGWNHTMIVKSNGNLVATGKNYYGQLGNGATTDLSIPVSVMNGVLSVGAGMSNSMMLKDDHTLWAVGLNSYGQLGNRTAINVMSPEQVMSGVAFVAVSLLYHTMIIKTDGILWATGYNEYGQLGNGTKTNVSNPVQVMSDVASVSVGATHTMIIKSDGTLWATGRNHYGQLGIGDITEDVTTPVRISFLNK